MMRSEGMPGVLVLGLSIGLLVGCGPPTREESGVVPMMAYSRPSPPPVSHIDAEISKVQKDIQFTKDVINQSVLDQLDALGQLNSGKTFVHSSDFNASGGQNPGETNAERTSRLNDDITAQRHELEKLQTKLKQLESDKQAAQQQTRGCFPADTPVLMANGLNKRFADIRPGDEVMTYDIGYDRKVARRVLEVYQVEGNHIYWINGELLTTGGERLLTPDGWQTVRNLKVGDQVHIGGKMVGIRSISLTRQDVTLHNMQVADTHNFYVSTDEDGAFLVHNTGGGGGGK